MNTTLSSFTAICIITLTKPDLLGWGLSAWSPGKIVFVPYGADGVGVYDPSAEASGSRRQIMILMVMILRLIIIIITMIV